MKPTNTNNIQSKHLSELANQEVDSTDNERTELNNSETNLTDNQEFDLTSTKVYLPLALAGAIGGFCNTGIHFVVPSSKKIDFIPGYGGSIFTELFIYMFFSVLVGAVLGPAVAMFSVGMPNKQNWNRLLVVTIIFGTFLTITIDTARKSISTVEKVQILEEEVQQKEEEIQQKEEEVKQKEEKIQQKEEKIEEINNAAIGVLEEKLPVVSDTKANPTNTGLRVLTLESTGCSSNETGVIDTNIKSLQSLRENIENTTDQSTKNDLIKQIDESQRKLNECLSKVSENVPTENIPTSQ